MIYVLWISGVQTPSEFGWLGCVRRTFGPIAVTFGSVGVDRIGYKRGNGINLPSFTGMITIDSSVV